MKPLAERFWEKVDKRGPNDCWEWAAGRFSNDYGLFRLLDGPRGAHRICWELTHGPIPDGGEICHSCDNPPCVNPAHLFLGTARINARDRQAKGRGYTNRGESVNTAKLTAPQVRLIRQRSENGEATRILAAEFGVKPEAIRKIMRGERWKHIR